MVSPGWGLVGRGVEYWGEGIPIISWLRMFYTSSHPWAIILFPIIWWPFGFIPLGWSCSTNPTWQIQLETQRIDLANRRHSDQRWRRFCDPKRCLEETCAAYHPDPPIRIFRSGRTSRIRSVSRGEKWGQTANMKLSVSFPSFLTYPHQKSNPETSKHEVVGWYWNTKIRPFRNVKSIIIINP